MSLGGEYIATVERRITRTHALSKYAIGAT